MKLSGRALKAIGYAMLHNCGKKDLFHLNKTGLTTVNEIDEFVYQKTGERLKFNSLADIKENDLKNKIKELIK